MFLVKLYSLEEHDNSTANVIKEIINTGEFGQHNNKLSLVASAFLMDSLEIGKSKYTDLGCVLLAKLMNLPGYNRVALHRSQICFAENIHLVKRDYPIGTGISYKKLLTHINRFVLNISIHDCEHPLKVRISDGLDGSGSHRVYQQVTSHPDVTTKIFLFFGFKVMSISDTQNSTLWENCSPKSHFSIRSVTILALTENKENVSFLMKTMINKETADIEANGLDLINGHHAKVAVLRSQLDAKMAQILSGAGGASCQFCTATFK